MTAQVFFYLSGAVAILSSLLVVTNKNAVHALLYLVVSLLSLAMCFYLLGAPFAAALQIIVYAGAIMVLFVFAVMMFNISQQDIERESRWLKGSIWIGPVLLVLVLLAEMVLVLQIQGDWPGQVVQLVDARAVGSLLFGPYLLAVEIASFLLLAGLVGGYHLAKSLTGSSGSDNDGGPA